MDEAMGNEVVRGRFPGFGISVVIGLVLLAGVFLASVTSGTLEIGAWDIYSLFREWVAGPGAAVISDRTGPAAGLDAQAPGGGTAPPSFAGSQREVKNRVLVSIRLPRTLSAIIAGMILGMAGGVFQCLLRNDLADPYVLGISAGGAVGAVASMLLGLTAGSTTALAAFAGASLTMAAVYGIARGGLASQTLIIAGIMVNATLSSLISLLVYLSPRVKPVMFWLMGSFSGSGPEGVVVMAASALALLLLGTGLGRWMDALAFGDATAASLGVRVRPMRILLFLVASCATGAVVAFHGVIGFAGLMVPHLARAVSGPCHRRLMPLCAIFGGIFLCCSDTIARSVLSPEELPIGVITGLLGGPFFIHVLRRRREP